MYAKFMKRLLDIVLSGIALVALSPVLLILTIIGFFAMGGNPFFTQARPGRINKKTGKERIFKLVKFRSMSNKKDQNGKEQTHCWVARSDNGNDKRICRAFLRI